MRKATWVGPVTLVNRRRGMHWTARASEDKELRTWAGLIAGRWDPVEEGHVHFQLERSTRRKVDADACAGAAKAILDGLVDAGVFLDDGPDHVTAITYHAPRLTGRDALTVLVAERRS